MATGDLVHLDLFFPQIDFPGTVCCVVRPEFMRLVETPLLYILLELDKKVMGPLPETFQLSVLLVS